MSTPDEVREHLEAQGYKVTVTPQADKVQLFVKGFDANINIWETTGTCNVQGLDQEAVEALLGDLVGRGRRRGRPAAAKAKVSSPVAKSKVFVVYGHDTKARTEVDAMLR